MHNYLSETQATQENQAGNVVKLPNELRFALWNDLVAWGVSRIGTINNHFCQAAIPEGWRVQPGNHPDWQELVDLNGRVRADIYFCSDFATTKAFMAMRRRFTTVFELSDEGTSLRTSVMDGNERLYATPWMQCQYADVSLGSSEFRDGKLHQKLEEQAKNWLKGNFPAWQNCLSYWELEAF